MILVTGGTGFLGRRLVHRWSETGEGPVVRVLSRQPKEAPGTWPPGVDVAYGDIRDEPSLRQAAAGVSAIVHLASKNVDPDGSGFAEVNVEGTRRLCRAAIEAGVESFLYVSSVGVYGHRSHRDADESTPVRPDTPFSRSKAAAERIILDHHDAGDLRALILRHRFVYGEGDAAVIPRLMGAARRYPFWISGGRARMSVVWVDDFAEIVRRLVLRGTRVEVDPIFHVTDGRPVSYRQVVGTICRAFGYPLPRFSLPYHLVFAVLRAREIALGIDPETAATSLTSMRLKLMARDNTFSNRKLAGLLPDLDYCSFEEGFRRSQAYYTRL